MLRNQALLDALLRVPFTERDAWIDDALGIDSDAPHDDIADLPRGAVPYLPCGVDAIVRAVVDTPVGADDVFVDLGAGLGRVALLVHLLSGARARGVELQAPLVERARELIRNVGVAEHVDIERGDAAHSRLLDEGTVFFIYASFSPAVLRDVLRSLENAASTRRRTIRLCAVGFDVPGAVHWLTARPVAPACPELTIYDAVRSRI